MLFTINMNQNFWKNAIQYLFAKYFNNLLRETKLVLNETINEFKTIDRLGIDFSSDTRGQT